MSSPPRIRPLDPLADAEVELVAARMRETLEEVVGPQTGRDMYTLDWLVARVRWHLDPTHCIGEVFVAEDAFGALTGHTIVRREQDAQGPPFGLFSTTFVAPRARKHGVAKALLARGEAWMLAKGLTRAVTYTAHTNTKLQQLYLGQGYTLTPAENGFVELAKSPLA